MPHRTEQNVIPRSRQPVSLLTVERAVSDLRRGRFVVILGPGGRAVLAQGAEAVTEKSAAALKEAAGGDPYLAITARRAAVLGIGSFPSKVVRIIFDAIPDAGRLHRLCNPLETLHESDIARIKTEVIDEHSSESAAAGLNKIARLLPAALLAPITAPDADDIAGWAARRDYILIDAGDIFQYAAVAARTLKKVSEADVPLVDSEQTRIIAFRPEDGGLEHLAIVIGTLDATAPVLVRLHSECFTGDLLGSLRCDCGDQLRGAIKTIAEHGSGVLLYLAQEGRGIGLVNKLRAYALQDRGFDTLDANEQLGFDADERIYLPAVQMLKQLGVASVRLLTNNPRKVGALTHHGIAVSERVPHSFPSNRHNEIYLNTKSTRGGHLF
ncbi:GTP cyclohydrolase II [Varunaivibrio sulfuroxidans]|uniref:GTP cyclohydrolase-2 n=1 Tax=Varunaivibrio sulfuroxidans TaxID=1773489 RepID=A0A4V2UP76_9PROT|nr:GTP cyclohydrolase II [Varunaivibrio sulfuroxidans]TCS64841.1 GTP cyclohydrolase II [Varunaivibrio sulfuroxidans]WES29858.1 GTP cyclohydrolase II [Varunaivibrio sulfuroxidans]